MTFVTTLEADKTMIFFAAAQAEKAAKYILNVKEEVVEEAEPQQAAALFSYEKWRAQKSRPPPRTERVRAVPIYFPDTNGGL